MIGLLSLPNRPVQAMLHEYEGYGPEQLQLFRDQPCQRKPWIAVIGKKTAV
jgi:hypothetical protein